jgi:mRNA interferase MazF
VALTRGTIVSASLRDPAGKPRPFLVLRSDHFARHSMVTLVAFTTALIDTPTLRVTVQPTEQNGLRAPSQAMIDHIQSVRIVRIGETIGQLGAVDMQAITRAVAVYLGLA